MDDENRTTTHNYNRTYVKRDEARIRESESREKVRLKELEYEDRQQKRAVKVLAVIVALSVLVGVVVWISSAIHKGVSESKGMITAGNHYDYEEENYEAVVKQFEEMGFKNIVTVDLDDSGIAFWNNGKVESVSIDGDDDFEETDYFYPDDKVIIKYH